jgi:hypothetical protein
MESAATAAASDLEALIPIVGAATLQRLFFFNLTISLVSLKHKNTRTHTHVQGRAPKALQQGILPCNTSATLFQLALTAAFFHSLNEVYIQEVSTQRTH